MKKWRVPKKRWLVPVLVLGLLLAIFAPLRADVIQCTPGAHNVSSTDTTIIVSDGLLKGKFVYPSAGSPCQGSSSLTGTVQTRAI